MTKKRHKTQREHKAEGEAKRAALFRLRFTRQYDTSAELAAAFIEGLKSEVPGLPPDLIWPNHSDTLERFIAENALEGTLLRQALKDARP